MRERLREINITEMLENEIESEIKVLGARKRSLVTFSF